MSMTTNLWGWWLTLRGSHQYKIIISLLIQCLWEPNLEECWGNLKGSFPWSRKSPWSHKVVWPLIRWSSEIIQENKAIISWLLQCLWPPKLAWWWLNRGMHIHTVTWPFDDMVLQNYVKIKSISQLPQWLWPPNLVGWSFTLWGFYP